MRINNNLPAMNSIRNIHTNSMQGDKSKEKIASGLAINRAADNAAGLAISELMRSQIVGDTQAMRNVQDGISLDQTAEGALSETHSILQRMRELSVQGANGIYDNNQRKAIQDELDQLKSGLDEISRNTSFNHKNLLDGSARNINIQNGPNELNSLQMSIDKIDTTTLGFDAPNNVAAVNVNSVASAGHAITILGKGVTQVSSQRNNLGAVQNRMEHNINSLAIANENQVAAESRIRDADMAAMIMNSTKTDILRQFNFAVSAQTNKQPQQILNLLGRS